MLHAASKKNKKIGSRPKHFYGSKEKIKVELTEKGWGVIDTVWAKKEGSGMNPEEVLFEADSLQFK